MAEGLSTTNPTGARDPGEALHEQHRALPPLTGRLAREQKTMRCMARIYCRDHHPNEAAHPCPACEEFLAYADRRLAKCPYGAAKPTCSNCPVHCYKPAQKQQAKEIMRYAGPRMLTRHPWLALLHLLDGRRKVEHPLAMRRRRDDAGR